MIIIYKLFLFSLFVYLQSSQNLPQERRADVPIDRASQIREMFCDPHDSRVLVNAHRGDWRNAPENSLRAIQNAITMGADIVEVDIRKTSDGVLVLMHDATVDRTTNGKGEVSDLDYDDVRSLFLRNGAGIVTRHKVPTLKEALQLVKGQILIQPDYKCRDCLDDIAGMLKDTGTGNQAVFGTKKTIRETRAVFGDLMEEALLVPGITGQTDPEAVIEEFIPMEPQAYVFKFTNDKASHLEYMARLKGHTRLWVQTIEPHRCGGRDDDLAVDDPNLAYGWLIDQGADIFLTDRPQLLLEYLRKRGLHD